MQLAGSMKKRGNIIVLSREDLVQIANDYSEVVASNWIGLYIKERPNAKWDD